jgi:hypothetical protein
VDMGDQHGVVQSGVCNSVAVGSGMRAIRP